MTAKTLILTTSLVVAPIALLAGQNAAAPVPTPGPKPAAAGLPPGNQGGLNPADIYKPLADEWPTYSGDYTGRRYSLLTQVDRETVKHLSLGWVGQITAGVPAGGGFGRGGGAATIVGGEGTGEFGNGSAANIKGAVLQVGGVLYISAPDNVWALDAHDGHELWHYFWKTKGGTHIGSRGMGMWHNYLFVETPDDYLVSLDARTGEERWHTVISDFDQQYFSTMAPVVVDNHVLVGTGNDLDSPGFLQSFDPETGALQWKFYTVPMKDGDPGLNTWPNLDAARHGGGQVWIPGSFDPETRLYIFGTGNPTPGYTGVGRKGDNLFTCTLMAVHVDTGKMAWYFQTSAHDTHDWDSAQTPILIDAVVDGKPRKLVSTAARNGYFFTVDRVTGEHVVTTRYGSTTNWGKGLRPNGVVEPDAGKEATIPGSLVSPVEGGVTNWPPPAYSPDTGLFYIQEHNGFNIVYLTDPDPRGSMGLGGKSVFNLGSLGDYLTAINPTTGAIAWRHKFEGGGGGGLLTTAGKLVFSGDGSGNFVAFDATNGNPIWHSRIGNISNAPETYMLDGRQYVLAAVGDTLYAFVMN
ncbi:MAG TPA: acido-empty-quinoprotein group A [Vicinamibacterales bacterium]|jgi:alcohol dehydrogenase (cytochrome c)|nr:acido-empty-quinoprotein group A [Vicinamibacterales bacterium]